MTEGSPMADHTRIRLPRLPELPNTEPVRYARANPCSVATAYEVLCSQRNRSITISFRYESRMTRASTIL